MNFQWNIPAFVERPDQPPISHLLFCQAFGQPRNSLAFQGHGHQHCSKVTAEKRFEVKVILLAMESVSNDAAKTRFLGVCQVGQCFR